MSEVLTIVGASVRAAAQSAVRAGYSVRAADLFADVDLRRVSHAIAVSNYPNGLVAALHGPHSGGWMYTGALENEPALVGRLAALRPLWGNPAEVLRRVRQPQLVHRALCNAGLRSPRMALDPCGLPTDGSWLRKPFRSAGGMGVIPWDSQSKNARARDVFYQQRVEGIACSAVYLAARRQAMFLGGTRQLIGAAWTGATGFRYGGSIGPIAWPPEILRNFARIGAVLAAEFDLVGLFGVDAILNSDGIWPVEVNPRYPASTELLDRAYLFSSVGLHVATCQSGELPRQIDTGFRHVHGKAVVFATHALTVSENDLVSLPESQGTWPALADIPAMGTRVEAGWPIATVLAQGDSELEVLDQLQAQTGELRIALERR